MFRSRFTAQLWLLTLTIVPLSAQSDSTTDSLASKSRQPAGVTVVIETSLGNIEAVIDTIHAPVSGRNFLRYVDAGLYQDGRFHRTVTPATQVTQPVKIEVIQAGISPTLRGKGFPAIPLERTSVTSLKHLDGTLSMARSGPDTATSDFFICIGAQPELDFGGKRNADGQGFAAFGLVTNGMEIVRKIQASAAQGETLNPPIGIKRIIRKGSR